MKKLLLSAIMTVIVSFAYSQGQNFWKASNQSPVQNKRIPSVSRQPKYFTLYDLDVKQFTAQVSKAKDRSLARSASDVIMSFPTADGNIENFRVVEANVLHPDLAAQYPHIKSYAGQGIEDPSASIRFSVSQAGFHGMVLSSQKGAYFIDPYAAETNTYMVYKRADLGREDQGFECLTEEDMDLPSVKYNTSERSTNDKKLRKYRLALSCTAEYGNIFAGSSGTDAQKKGNILAQMNITMTRVNGIYERDLAITMEIVPNNTAIMYYGTANSDPWANEWNSKTQQVIDAAIGNANYDIGHNFNTTGGGNAGCIGCVCQTGSKGSAYTGRSNPTGDAFDVDYVAHEMGHQFGGYHVMNTCSRSGSGSTEVEPASGSSIMGYAGICSTNIQSNSDAYFAYVNIRDISANVQGGVSSSCAQIINIGNNAPTANAGADYTIPKSTPFVLKGQGTDPDGDVLTYTWEQNDPQQASGSGSPQSTWTVGPMFRSKEGTTSPDRYMPQISDVVAGNLTPTWEVIPSVGRTLNFSLTVRDNKAGGGQTAEDLMRVTVSGTAGPFTVSAPNTAVTWNVGQSQTVTWNVSGTNASPINCANVNILLSTDGGFTYPVVLAANTPNDGSQTITVPNNVGSTNRIKIEAVGNIFYDISKVNFTIAGAVSCNATVPTGLSASGVTSSSANLSWNSVSGATYDVQYRVVGTSTWTTVASATNSLSLSSLAASTNYEAQVRSKCTSTSSAYSSSVNFTTSTVSITYCASNGNSTADEYIGRVQLNTINNASGAGTGGYSNFTAISTNLSKGSAYTITVTPTWTGTVYNEGYAVFIDYNQDGDFTDAGETVWTRSASKTTPVSGSFTVPAGALSGATRMRVSMRYNTIPTSCGSFNYGEVEDYTVQIGGTADTQAPTTPTSLSASGTTQTTTNLSWTASTDNVGVTGYDVYRNGALLGSTTSTSYAVSGLTAATSYTFAVRAKDAAGNISTAASINVTTQANSCVDVTLTLKFDNYPEETSWAIRNASNTVVASGGTYGSQADGSTLVINNCLPAGCYTFTINDSYGDGICCAYGNGNYSLTDGSTVLASGGSFTSSQTTNFCVGTGKTDRNAISELSTNEIILYPNPVRDFLNISVSNESVKSVTVYSANGARVHQVSLKADGLDVSNLNSGIYLITIETDSQVVKKKFIKE
ncbi:zinc-dependent metalloprotease family protein [Cytophagales bacterium LB-30]|uniref:Zinc-dependent metalloprotease family protein n=1 Tax=Shiella aurantiaca TaxID=3058365 RepID=A0ABT8F5X6_9BACT|nr:zinc-dependent metalloprotease family protein [Shiella aurantiaca]MDN4165850.1 zinc-dependent metalloprotease family protein [Shiella aurantiaca]